MTLSVSARRIALGVLLVGVIGTAGCDGKPAPADGVVVDTGPMPSPYAGGPSVKTSRAMEAGQWDSPAQMYAATCKGCHDTGVGPALFGRNLGEKYITYVVRHGRNGMPGFFPSEYSDADVKVLAAWIDQQPAAQAGKSEGGPQ